VLNLQTAAPKGLLKMLLLASLIKDGTPGTTRGRNYCRLLKESQQQQQQDIPKQESLSSIRRYSCTFAVMACCVVSVFVLWIRMNSTTANLLLMSAMTTTRLTATISTTTTASTTKLVSNMSTKQKSISDMDESHRIASRLPNQDQIAIKNSFSLTPESTTQTRPTRGEQGLFPSSSQRQPIVVQQLQQQQQQQQLSSNSKTNKTWHFQSLQPNEALVDEKTRTAIHATTCSSTGRSISTTTIHDDDKDNNNSASSPLAELAPSIIGTSKQRYLGNRWRQEVSNLVQKPWFW
jgi:hypothetical protein